MNNTFFVFCLLVFAVYPACYLSLVAITHNATFVTCLYSCFQIVKEQFLTSYFHTFFITRIKQCFIQATTKILRNLIEFFYFFYLSGGASRDRTDDPLLAKQVLSQLSYGPRV